MPNYVGHVRIFRIYSHKEWFCVVDQCLHRLRKIEYHGEQNGLMSLPNKNRLDVVA